MIRSKKIVIAIGLLVLTILFAYRYITYDFYISESMGQGVNIAVLDSGYNSSKINGKYIKNIELNTDIGHEDNFGHGTNVIDIITGIVPEASIISLKVLDDNGRGNKKIVLEALNWCLQNKVDIINMSFSLTNDDKDIKNKLLELSDNGIIIVASYDNLGKVSYPAEYNFVIGVRSGHQYMNKEMIKFNNDQIIAFGGDNKKSRKMFNSYATARITSFVAQNINNSNVIRRLLDGD